MRFRISRSRRSAKTPSTAPPDERSTSSPHRAATPSPAPRTFTGWNTIGKLTLTPWANQTFTGRYLDSHANISNISFSSLVPTEADARQTQHTKTWGLSYDAIVNAHWLANVSLGHTPSS